MLAMLAGVFTLTACSGGGQEAARPEAPEAPSAPSTTTTLVPAPDFSQVSLPPVSGRRGGAGAVDVRPGNARLSGTVLGPEGPVPGAVVSAERLVGDSAATVDGLSGPDGRWTIGGVKGGRYRVRAWRQPDLALLEPEILFLSSTEGRELNLVLQRAGGPAAVASIAPNPPLVNQPANLVVRLAQRTVDSRGVVRADLLAGAPVELSGPGQWQVRSANPTVTDAGGVARWEVVCAASGLQPLTAILVGTPLSAPMTIPPCR